MKVLSLTLIIFLTNCGFVDVKDAIYKFSDSLQSYRVAGVEATITNNLVTATVPDDVNLKAVAPEFVTSDAYLFVNGKLQKSGETIVDLSSDVSYQAVSFSGKKATYVVRVKHANDTVIEEYSNVIKIESIDGNGVNVSIARSPMPELLGVNANDIDYCVNISEEAPGLMFAVNQRLMYANEFVCLETYSFEDLPKTFDFKEGKEVFINYVAIHNSVMYPYNRLYIDNEMEFFTGTCQDFYNEVEEAKFWVLTGDLNCEDVTTESLALADLKLNGNGYTFYNDYSLISSLNQCYFTNINYVNINGITQEITFSIMENITVKDTCIFKDDYAGIIAGKIFDLVLNNITIDANIYSSGNHVGLVTGLYINNFPMIYPVMSNMKLTGLVNGVDFVGGAFGFIISDFYLKNISVDVNVAGMGEYVGCLAGGIASPPVMTNVQELCQ